MLTPRGNLLANADEPGIEPEEIGKGPGQGDEEEVCKKEEGDKDLVIFSEQDDPPRKSGSFPGRFPDQKREHAS